MVLSAGLVGVERGSPGEIAEIEPLAANRQCRNCHPNPRWTEIPFNPAPRAAAADHG